jgi:hypothetical protein
LQGIALSNIDYYIQLITRSIKESQTSNVGKSNTQSSSKPQQCHNCGKTGHIKKDCTARYNSVRSFEDQLFSANPTNRASPSTKSLTPTPSKGYQLVDIGVNLTHKQFSGDLENVINKSINAGVNLLVITGTNSSL